MKTLVVVVDKTHTVTLDNHLILQKIPFLLNIDRHILRKPVHSKTEVLSCRHFVLKLFVAFFIEKEIAVS